MQQCTLIHTRFNAVYLWALTRAFGLQVWSAFAIDPPRAEGLITSIKEIAVQDVAGLTEADRGTQ